MKKSAAFLHKTSGTAANSDVAVCGVSVVVFQNQNFYFNHMRILRICALQALTAVAAL